MSERARNLLLGLTVIVGAVSLGVILLLFGYLPQWIQDGYEVRVELNHAAGLSSGSRVKLSGIDVGVLRTVRLSDPPRRGVVAIAFINPGVQLPQELKVSVEAPIIGGSPTLAFDIDHLTEQQMQQNLPSDGQGTVQGRVPSLATKFAEELKAALDEPLEQFERLSHQWTQVALHMNRLIEPRSTEQVDSGDQAGNLTTMLARADARLAELQEAIKGLTNWLHDETLKADILATAAQAVKATKTLESGADSFVKLADDARKRLDGLTNRYVALADDLSNSISSVQSMIKKADTNQGTVGMMLNDPSLYNNLNDTIERLNQALQEVQLLIQKWMKEGLAVKT